MFMWLFYVDVASFFYVHVHASVSELLCFRIFDSNEKDNHKNRAKDSSIGVFLSIWKISESTFLMEHLRTTASTTNIVDVLEELASASLVLLLQQI